MDQATQIANQMAKRYSFDEVVAQLKERHRQGIAAHTYVSFMFHYTVWCSTGEFKDQISHNIEYLGLLLKEVVKRPGVGLGLHFEVFDYEVIRTYRPDVWSLIQQGIENKSLDVIAGGFIDYNGIITPLDDLRRNHERWREYIESHLKISTKGAFLWPNESQYHPNMPKIWDDYDFSGIVLFPFHEQLQRYNFEPLHLESTADSSSVVIATFNDDSRLFEPHRFGFAVDEKHTWQHRYLQFLELGARYSSPDMKLYDKPIFAIGHDITLFKPLELGALLDRLIEDDVLEVLSLRDYIAIAKPQRSVYLDQGGWDTSYHWETSSEGWFTQQPWCRHINGLVHKAHEDYEAARWAASQTGSDANVGGQLAEAEEGLLYSERTTSRAHWSHHGPRVWCQDYAAKSLKASNEVVQRYLQKLPSKQGHFTLSNLHEQPFEGLVRLDAMADDGLGDHCTIRDCDSGREVLGQVVRQAFNHVTGQSTTQLLFHALLGPHKSTAYTLEPASGGSTATVELTEAGNTLTARSDTLQIAWRLDCGGRIDQVRRLDGDVLLEAGDIVKGRTLDRQFAGFDAPDREMQTDNQPATWKLIANGPIYAVIEIATTIGPNLGRKGVQYLIQKGSPVIRATWCFGFDNPLWFQWEYESCARILFHTNITDPQIRWNMPGGWLPAKYALDRWAGFDFAGAVLLGNDTKGLALVSKFYPNGPRMVLSKRNTLGVSFSGTQRLPPYHLSSASLGETCFEMAIVPSGGINDLRAVDVVYNMMNHHLYLRNLPQSPYTFVTIEEQTQLYPNERFQQASTVEAYGKRFLSALT